MKATVHPWILLAMTLAWSAGCGESHEFHPPDEAERVARADSLYSAALFDTIAWDSDAARIRTGNLVFADECRRCHGPLARGGTEYAEENGLDVPSLVQADWPYAGSIDSVRYRMFVGHVSGMPNWGIGRLTPRQIDAAAAYILRQLRPEVLGDSIAIPGG